MSMSSRPVIKTGAGADLAFAVVLLASYLATFSALQTASAMEILLMISLGIAYVSIGIYGYGFCARSERQAFHLAYFAVQVPLGGLIVFLAEGAGFNAMILLPLAGHSVMLLSQWRMVVVNLVILGAYVVAVLSFAHNPAVVFDGLPIFLGGQVFIVAFTQMAVNEEKVRREVERLANELAAANQRLREYALQVEELAITKERNRLAREIHDGLGHYLTTVHMQLRAAQAIMEKDPQHAKEIMRTAQNVTQEALADIRRSVGALRLNPGETMPLAEEIRKMLLGYELAGMVTDFKVIGKPRSLNPKVNLTLYRAAQEGLSNISKHADASQVCVELNYADEKMVCLTVQDDGRGAEVLEGGFGLTGLRERALLLEGEFQVTSAPGEGFILKIGVPG
ncbi:MAG: sensor histidine kinase [Anaerolineaceae bacterium]|jgi:signal transduction histidine kinase